MHFDTRTWPSGILVIGVVLGLFSLPGSRAGAATHFLDNGLIRVGVSDSFGGAIEYLAESNGPGIPGKNDINCHDADRLVQYAYYGDPITSGGPVRRSQRGSY